MWALCVVRVGVCVWCVCVWESVWCGTQKKSPCVDSKRPRVYRHHARKRLHMRAWCRYTQGRFKSTHGGFLDGHTGRGEGKERRRVSPSVLLTINGPRSYHLLERFTERNLGILHILKFENRSRTTRARFLQSFAFPDKAVQFQLSGGTLRRERQTQHPPTHPPPPLLSLPHTQHTHTITYTNTNTNTKTHTQRHTHTHTTAYAHTNAHAHAHVYVHARVYVNVYVYEFVYVYEVLETATCSKKKIVEGHKLRTADIKNSVHSTAQHSA